jgi:5-hydroxyisourate hydrolase
MSLSTHVLDTSIGRPAAGVEVRLEAADGDGFSTVSSARTDADGRCKDLVPAAQALAAGRYRLSFESGAYFAGRGIATFYPRIQVLFEIVDPAQHHHVPLLLSPFGYSTYRGS